MGDWSTVENFLYPNQRGPRSFFRDDFLSAPLSSFSSCTVQVFPTHRQSAEHLVAESSNRSLLVRKSFVFSAHPFA